MIGHLLDAVIGDIDHHDAVFASRSYIDAVEADTVAHDHLEIGERRKHLAREWCILIQQDVGISALSDDIGSGTTLTDCEGIVVSGQCGFFVVVMGLIHGLQGGFEQARLMTEGGPAGTTTTLSYYIYTQGFQRLDLGYGAAVAWVLFSIIMVITLINWRYGNRASDD